MVRAFFRPSSGAQWLQWQPLVLPSYRGDSRVVFMVGPAGPTTTNSTATTVVELLMMGVRTPETCWAVNKGQDNKLKKLLHLVGDLFEQVHSYGYRTVPVWKTEASLRLMSRVKILCHKQSAQASVCRAPPRSGTVCGTVHSSHASVQNAFLWKKPTPIVKPAQVGQTPISCLLFHSPQLERINKGGGGGGFY